ncbi:HAD family hydrolase [Halobacillus litoralis]|uniref:HAD family hydrolase n=1 Tax=Halobacillus litoralis TaxID=45668 RepID=UPI001CFD930A|nr:HAD family hydrolase [Halobacillus litoralis]
MIKAVIFDLDGTLLNRDASVEEFIEKQYDRWGKFLHHIPRRKYMERFIALDHRGYVWKDIVYQKMIDELSIKGLTWEDLLQDYSDYFIDSCVPFPHLKDMLEELKHDHFHIGIITNGKGQFQMDNIKALGIHHYTDTILISDWEGVKKPDPLIFQRAADSLDVSIQECVFIGDHPEKDVKAAKDTGMKGVWKRDDEWSGVEADAVVDDLCAIPRLIQQMNTTLQIQEKSRSM